MKTLVELFDTCQLTNVIAGISCLPEKIIFLGDAEVMNQDRRDALDRFFRMRKQTVKLEYISVKIDSYSDILTKMERVLSMNQDVCIDITGGREMVLTVLGEAAYCHNLPLIRFDVSTGKMLRIKNAQHIPIPTPAIITVRQSVVLNGGEVISPQNYLSPQQLTPSFCKEIRSLFAISKQKPKLWNQFAIALEGLLNCARVTPELKVYADLSGISETQYKKLTDYNYFDQLSDAGLILGYKEENGKLFFQYKNEQVHQCMSKAGNILEIYSYMLLNELSKAHPGLFGDMRMGVLADWDGKMIPRCYSGTRNEIDLMVTKNAIPIFISCKHGEVLKEALYELHTVAEHYGGEYAKKVLITAELSNSPTKRKSFLDRASDMGITVIYNVNRITEERFLELLCEIGTEEKKDSKENSLKIHKNYI
ncbi:MAG: DUF1887 family protein [Clostridia bacterium]|nr:DUF1887 family protein [Clostridia bacterium]